MKLEELKLTRDAVLKKMADAKTSEERAKWGVYLISHRYNFPQQKPKV